jgi:uncharacterized metal-binding protein YceD (DUF177 family)
MTPEFSRTVRIDTLGTAPRQVHVEADAGERKALTRRFDLVAIDRLEADLALTRSGELISASGTLSARVTQSCVATGEPLQADVQQPFEILFTPEHFAPIAPDEEIELSEGDCDVVFYTGGAIDVGEAVAETLSLSLDPFPRTPGAEEALKQAGVKSEAEAGPFAALAALKKNIEK